MFGLCRGLGSIWKECDVVVLVHRDARHIYPRHVRAVPRIARSTVDQVHVEVSRLGAVVRRLSLRRPRTIHRTSARRDRAATSGVKPPVRF